MKKHYFIFRLLMSLIPALSGGTTVSAESIFLIDGSIVDGKITKETDGGIVLRKSSDMKDVVLKYADIMRISYDTEFRKKSFLRLQNGEILAGYIVEETKTHYIYRKSLNSPEEFRAERGEVVALSGEQFLSKGAYYSLGIIPGAAQFYTDRNMRGGIFLATSIASFAFTGYAYHDLRQKRASYHRVSRGESTSTFDSRYNAYRNSSRRFVASLCFSGLLYAANWIDVLYFGSGLFSQPADGGNDSAVRYGFSFGSRYALSGEGFGSTMKGVPADHRFFLPNDGLCFSLSARMWF